MKNKYSFIKNNLRQIILLSVLVITVFILIGVGKVSDKKEIRQSTLTKNNYDYSSISKIVAKAYYVYDIKEDKVLYSKNENEGLPLASVTKLMTGLAVIKTLPEGTIVEIGQDAINQEGDSGLFVGEKWTLKNLLDFTLVTSSNDGIFALKKTLDEYLAINNTNTIYLMNELAVKMQLKNTLFLNESGLDMNQNISGAYSSAQDISKLLTYIIKNEPSMLQDTIKENGVFVSEDGLKHSVKNTNTSVNKIPSLIGSKTGFTDLAGGNLAIIFDAGLSHPIAIVVLGSTQEERFSDVEKLIKLTLQKISEF